VVVEQAQHLLAALLAANRLVVVRFRRPARRRKRRPPIVGMTSVCSKISQRTTCARSKASSGRSGVESARKRRMAFDSGR
jgi:predicted AAA+ superfamily ATPase